MVWLPEGRKAAVCFSIDDVHPSTSADPYEAGGDLAHGALGLLERLLERHPLLRVTLFVTPDWRPIQLVRNRFLARLPFFRERVYHVDLHEAGRFRVDRHSAFVTYLNNLPRTEVAPHGLHHVHRGSHLAVEFQEQDFTECLTALQRGLDIFDAAGLKHVKGFAPPGWNLTSAMRQALAAMGFSFVSSARDLRTPIEKEAKCSMSGLEGVSLIFPERVKDRELVHLPTNFQATSSFDRAERIIACSGLLSIKAHIFKRGGGYTLLDGLDESYCDYLDKLFDHLECTYGSSLWWASMAEVADRWRCEVAVPLTG